MENPDEEQQAGSESEIESMPTSQSCIPILSGTSSPRTPNLLMNNNELRRVKLRPIPEVETMKCKCCRMKEECTGEYIDAIRNMYLGHWICGLCAEAVKAEMEKGRGFEDALREHMSACYKFNKVHRANPILSQVEAMKKMLRKSAAAYSGESSSSSSVGDSSKHASTMRGPSCMPTFSKEKKRGKKD